VQIARHLRNDIAAGRLRDGVVLPPTRKLAGEWGVSVFTISEAMKILADEGLVVSESRSRRVVRAPEQERRAPAFSGRPHVVLVGGYAGSGKSELSRVMARETGWCLLDKDTITRPIVEKALEALGKSPHDRESDAYLSEVRPREYEALAAAIRENLECGTSVIATAPFILEFKDPAWLQRAADEYGALNAHLTVVWLYCDVRSMHTYIRRRAAARDVAKLADWDQYSTGLDIDFRPGVDHIVVENCASSASLQSQARTVLERLQASA
jgi:predicted kinase